MKGVEGLREGKAKRLKGTMGEEDGQSESAGPEKRIVLSVLWGGEGVRRLLPISPPHRAAWNPTASPRNDSPKPPWPSLLMAPPPLPENMAIYA